MNTLAQGGLPVDVAETVAWLRRPGSAGVNGNVVRVCGQSLLGRMKRDSTPRVVARRRARPASGRRPEELPDAELHARGVEVDRDHLAAYDRVCGFRLRDELPATYPHVLAFPLAMELMAARRSRSRCSGWCTSSNRIEQRAADPRGRARSTCACAPPTCARTTAGTQFDVVAEAAVDGEVVWRERQHLPAPRGRRAAAGPARRRPSRRPPTAVWGVPGDIGRRYAARVRRPQPDPHAPAQPPRLFGMPGAIAHGMWTKARCLAALEGELPAPTPSTCAFKLPLRIPGRGRRSPSRERRVRRARRRARASRT